MAEMTVNQPDRSIAPDDVVQDFGAIEAALLLRNATAARSILRAVALAARAQFEGSVEYKDNHMGRWQPVMDEVCSRLEVVRDLSVATRSAPNVDWFTPLALVEAIAAALWNDLSLTSAAGRAPSDGLSELEIESAAQVVIESLDSLMEQCASEGVFDLARAAKTNQIH